MSPPVFTIPPPADRRDRHFVLLGPLLPGRVGIGFTQFPADDWEGVWGDGLGSPRCLISHRFRTTTDSSPFPIGGGSESVGAMERRCLGSDKGMRTEESRIAFPGPLLPSPVGIGFTVFPADDWEGVLGHGLGSPLCLISHRFRTTTDSSPFPIGGGSESVGAMERRTCCSPCRHFLPAADSFLGGDSLEISAEKPFLSAEGPFLTLEKPFLAVGYPCLNAGKPCLNIVSIWVNVVYPDRNAPYLSFIVAFCVFHKPSPLKSENLPNVHFYTRLYQGGHPGNPANRTPPG